MIALTDNNTTKLTCGLFGLVLQPNRLAITDRLYFFLGIKFRKNPALLPFR